MAKLHLNKPNRPKGELIFIPGLGEFANGETHDVPKLDEDLYIPAKAEEDTSSSSTPVGSPKASEGPSDATKKAAESVKEDS